MTNHRWPIGILVQKRKGSSWRGRVCGHYTNEPHTSEGYCVASVYEPGNVQVYPAAALEEWFCDDL